MRKLLFALAALAATALAVLAAWALTELGFAALHLPRWALFAGLFAIFAASGLYRWRKRRAGITPLSP